LATHRLRKLGCHYAQGYYFLRPVPAEEFDAAAARIGALLNQATPCAAWRAAG